MPLAALAPAEDALAAAREILPGWVVWGRVLAPPVFGILVQLCISEWFIVLLERRAGPGSGLHWTERARRIADFSAPLRACNFCLCAPALFVPALLESALDPIPRGLVVLLTISMSLVVWYLHGRRLQRRVLGVEIPVREWTRATYAGLLTGWLPFFAFLSCLIFVGKHPRDPAIVLLLVCTAVLIWSAFAGAWRLLPRLGLAHDLDVRELVGESGRGVRFLVFDSTHVNAYAVQSLGWVLVTQRARQVLTDAELAAVLHHELGHLSESRRVQLMRYLPVLLYLTLAWVRPLLGWIGPPWTLALLALGWLAAWYAGTRTRKLEQRADAHAHASVEDSRVYAHALEKIGQANLSPAVTDQQGTHPHLYDRMVAAGFTPEYPRPTPTRPTVHWRILIAVVVCIELARVDALTRPSTVDKDEHSLLVALALGGWTAEHLGTLATVRDGRGDRRAAEIFRAAAQAAGSQR